MSSLLAFGLLVYFKRCGYATSDLYVYHTHLAIYLICHPFEIRVHGPYRGVHFNSSNFFNTLEVDSEIYFTVKCNLLTHSLPSSSTKYDPSQKHCIQTFRIAGENSCPPDVELEGAACGARSRGGVESNRLPAAVEIGARVTCCISIKLLVSMQTA